MFTNKLTGKFILLNQGTINVQSDLGLGTKFILNLRNRRAEGGNDYDVDAQNY